MKRFFSILLLIMMIISSFPVATFASGCDTGAHNWDGGAWVDGAPANCLTTKTKRYTCLDCGATREWEENGACVPGPKTWIRPQGTTCLEFGVWEITCVNCGEWLEGGEEPGPHDWQTERVVEPDCVNGGLDAEICSHCGQWLDNGVQTPAVGHQWKTEILEEPTCTEPGWQESFCSVCNDEKGDGTEIAPLGHDWGIDTVITPATCVQGGRANCVCSRCGATEERDTDPLGHRFGAWHVTVEPQVGVPGEEQRECSRCGRVEKREIPALTGETPAPGGEGYRSPDALIEKYVVYGPANGEYFVPGETIVYAVIFMNACYHELHDVEVMDPLKGNNEDSVLTIEPVVGPLDTLYLYFSYVVTEEDAERGYVENTASAFWLNPEIEEWSSCDSNTVIVKAGPGEADPADSLFITKAIANVPANGEYFVPGEEIEFSITVVNNSDSVIPGFVITDHIDPEWVFEHSELGAGEYVTATVRYTVEELDAVAGGVSNVAFVRVFTSDGYLQKYSNTVFAPCGYADEDGDGEPDDPFGIFVALDVTKEVESLPLNGVYYTEGETVAYKITYTNGGEIPLIDVLIYDPMSGFSEIGYAETIQPGESRVCYLDHVVTAEDVERGYIANVAIGQFVMGGYVNTVFSETVLVDTDGVPDEFFDGFVPGVIDIDKLRAGESYCRITATGRSGASYAYEVDFCGVHRDTQAAVLALTEDYSSSDVPEQVVELWRTAVEALYQEVMEAADDVAKAHVMAEYVQFRADVANYEAMLRMIYPDAPETVTWKIAAMWEEKCVSLCCEIHAAASERTDSLMGAEVTEGAADVCESFVTEEAEGEKSCSVFFCEPHSEVFAMIDELAFDENPVMAWTAVRQSWMLEMTNAYKGMDGPVEENLVRTEYSIFIRWLKSYEVFLTALYPENPEIVAELLARQVMDRVNDLCRFGK